MQLRRHEAGAQSQRLFVVSDCDDIAVRFHRIAPQMKWCHEGVEIFTSSQKRVWAQGFTPRHPGSETRWWFTQPRFQREQLGFHEGLDVSHRETIDYGEHITRLITLIGRGELSLVCAYLPDSHEWGPDFRFIKEAASCPSQGGTFLVLGNFAWVYCEQELLAFFGAIDINRRPAPSPADMAYLEDLLRTTNNLFRKRVLLDYEVPQTSLWAWSTRGKRYAMAKNAVAETGPAEEDVVLDLQKFGDTVRHTYNSELRDLDVAPYADPAEH
ncbi:unnamed protein product [Amoebophrya sp. A25]|nr:unnamed protein product [Amoebophrya sp. A25]|eukprot:GSA25T00013327001.1